MHMYTHHHHHIKYRATIPTYLPTCGVVNFLFSIPSLVVKVIMGDDDDDDDGDDDDGDDAVIISRRDS